MVSAADRLIAWACAASLDMISHKSLYCKGFRNIFSKTCVMKISTLYMDILVKLQTR